MAAPLAPAGLIPRSGQSIVATKDNVFTWQSDGTQAAYYVEWVRNAPGATSSNTGWQTDSLSSHTFVANTFTNTWEYKWRVKVRNSAGQESVFSDWAMFGAGSASGVAITFPANDLDVLSTVPVYQHEYSNPDGLYQVAYQYRLFTGTTWDDFDALTAAQQESMTWDQLEAYSTGIELWNTGRVESRATSVVQPSDKLLIMQYWYKVQVTIWDNAGNEISSDIRTYGLLVESVPQIPTITVVPDGENGRNVATIINPLPDVGQAVAHHNRLYRRKLNGDWELVQDDILDGIGYDTTCRAGTEEEYAASAVSADGIESSKSESVTATCNLNSYWFTNLTTSATVKLHSEPRWGQMQSERNRAEYSPIDEKYITVLYGPQRFYRGSFQALLFKPSDDTLWRDYMQTIADVLDSDSGDTVLLRSPFGDMLKMNIYNLQFEQNDRMDETRWIRFDMVEVVEAVPVGSFTYDTPPTPLNGFWIVDPDTGKGMRLNADPKWGAMATERDRAEMIGLSSEMPTVSYGNKKAKRSGFTGLILPPSSGSLAQEVMRLRELVDSRNKKPLLFRTISRDMVLVDVYGFTFELYDRTSQARKVSFEFVEVGPAGSIPAPEPVTGRFFLMPNFPAKFEEAS